MNPNHVRDLLSVQARLLKVLTDVQRLRSKPIVGRDWVDREHRAMLGAVNDERKARGISELTLEVLRRIERPALGHSDYASKFALYCAEAALGGWIP